MKKLLQLEQLAQLVLSLFALSMVPVHLSWWLWPILFLAPDISMLGYLINTKTGAWAYNLAHHKLVAAAVIIVSVAMHYDYLLISGLLLWAHASFDRVLGYGLKYEDAFQHTHLGFIGEKMADKS